MGGERERRPTLEAHEPPQKSEARRPPQEQARYSTDTIPAAAWAPPAQLDALDSAVVQCREAVDAVAERGDASPPGAAVQMRARKRGDAEEVKRAAAEGVQGAGGDLPYLDQIQQSFGKHDVGNVQAHVAPEANVALGAQAYAMGDRVAFRGSNPDLHTVAHEAAHVVQQRGGVQLKDGVGQPGDKYEQHADAVADQVVQGRSSEALLSEAAGDVVQSLGSAVQCLHQPIVAAAPATAISIRQFIELVEAEEARWPPAEQTQTALMITRLRKIFYGTEGWDDYLIPDASDVDPGYDVSEEETGREDLELVGPNADIVRRRQVTTDRSSGASPAIASQQEVRLEDGTFCDVGHVFAGLDAANHPDAVEAPLNVARVESNLGAVTWVGDLGSVLAEWIFEALNNGTPTADEMQGILNEYASPQDMLGNIDAYVMADEFDITNSSGQKVSQLLRAYYLGEANTPGGQAREHRYSRFCSLIGLTGWDGSQFSNEDAWVAQWAPEVGGAAALYVGANTEGFFAIPGRLGVITAIQEGPVAPMQLRLFLDALKARVAAEPPASGGG